MNYSPTLLILFFLAIFSYVVVIKASDFQIPPTHRDHFRVSIRFELTEELAKFSNFTLLLFNGKGGPFPESLATGGRPGDVKIQSASLTLRDYWTNEEIPIAFPSSQIIPMDNSGLTTNIMLQTPFKKVRYVLLEVTVHYEGQYLYPTSIYTENSIPFGARIDFLRTSFGFHTWVDVIADPVAYTFFANGPRTDVLQSGDHIFVHPEIALVQTNLTSVRDARFFRLTAYGRYMFKKPSPGTDSDDLYCLFNGLKLPAEINNNTNKSFAEFHLGRIDFVKHFPNNQSISISCPNSVSLVPSNFYSPDFDPTAWKNSTYGPITLHLEFLDYIGNKLPSSAVVELAVIDSAHRPAIIPHYTIQDHKVQLRWEVTFERGLFINNTDAMRFYFPSIVSVEHQIKKPVLVTILDATDTVHWQDSFHLDFAPCTEDDRHGAWVVNEIAPFSQRPYPASNKVFIHLDIDFKGITVEDVGYFQGGLIYMRQADWDNMSGVISLVKPL